MHTSCMYLAHSPVELSPCIPCALQNLMARTPRQLTDPSAPAQAGLCRWPPVSHTLQMSLQIHVRPQASSCRPPSIHFYRQRACTSQVASCTLTGTSCLCACRLPFRSQPSSCSLPYHLGFTADRLHRAACKLRVDRHFLSACRLHPQAGLQAAHTHPPPSLHHRQLGSYQGAAVGCGGEGDQRVPLQCGLCAGVCQQPAGHQLPQHAAAADTCEAGF